MLSTANRRLREWARSSAAPTSRMASMRFDFDTPSPAGTISSARAKTPGCCGTRSRLKLDSHADQFDHFTCTGFATPSIASSAPCGAAPGTRGAGPPKRLFLRRRQEVPRFRLSALLPASGVHPGAGVNGHRKSTFPGGHLGRHGLAVGWDNTPVYRACQEGNTIYCTFSLDAAGSLPTGADTPVTRVFPILRLAGGTGWSKKAVEEIYAEQSARSMPVFGAVTRCRLPVAGCQKGWETEAGMVRDVSQADKKRVLLLTTTTGYQTRAFVEAAERMGLEVAFGSDRCHVLDDPWQDGALALHFEDATGSAWTVVEYARSHPVAAIVALGDRPTPTAARACRALGLAHHPPEATDLCRDKYRSRERLRDAGLRVPAFSRFPLTADPQKIFAAGSHKVGFPCVLKPLALAGSRGVIRADDAEDAARAFERIRNLL